MTVEELDALCTDFINKKEYQKKAEARMDEIVKETKDAQTKVIAALEELGKTENSGTFGKVKVVQREYYKCVDKEACYQWLKKRGDFDSLASVNAQTLSSYMKDIIHEKHEQGDFSFMPPGIQDSTSDYTYLKITK